jgi:hypothetical protein
MGFVTDERKELELAIRLTQSKVDTENTIKSYVGVIKIAQEFSIGVFMH